MKKISKKDLEIKPRVISQLNDTVNPKIEGSLNPCDTMRDECPDTVLCETQVETTCGCDPDETTDCDIIISSPCAYPRTYETCDTCPIEPNSIECNTMNGDCPTMAGESCEAICEPPDHFE